MNRARDPFPSTLTQVVFLAGHGEPAARRRAQNETCRRYWLPLHVYARRRGYCADAANDLTQGFLAQLVANDELARVDLARRTFRPWLRRCFSNYIANVRAHGGAIYVGGAAVHVAYDSAEAERYQSLTSTAPTPDEAFEQTRALLVVHRAFAALRAEWLRKGQGRRFDALAEFVTFEDERRYRALAAELGESEVGVRKAVERLRGEHREFLFREAARYSERAEDLDSELEYLLGLLANSPGAPLGSTQEAV